MGHNVSTNKYCHSVWKKLFYLEKLNKIPIKKIYPLSVQMDNDREAVGLSKAQRFYLCVPANLNYYSIYFKTYSRCITPAIIETIRLFLSRSIYIIYRHQFPCSIEHYHDLSRKRSATLQLMREDIVHTYPPLHIAKCSFIRLSEVEQCSTPQHRIRTQTHWIERTRRSTHCATALCPKAIAKQPSRNSGWHGLWEN